MGFTLGIDIGGSTTKIVGMKKNELVSPFQVKATDPVTSLFGAFGKFLMCNNMKLMDIDKIAITGVGSSFIDKPIYGIPTRRIEEFQAIGLGGLYLSALPKALIVSMGTGTALVYANNENKSLPEINHIGGTGIGGGTLVGLSKQILNINKVENIIELSKKGNLNNVDLVVGDISKHSLPSLPSDTTASNFGKNLETASPNDIAKAIVNLVFQSIGTNSVFAAQNRDVSDIVLIGNLSAVPDCGDYFKLFTLLHGYQFIVPLNSNYATAVGAALAFESDEAVIVD